MRPASREPRAYVPALGQGGLLTCLPFGASVWSPLPLQCLLPRALHVTVNLNMVTCLLMLCPSKERCHSRALSISCSTVGPCLRASSCSVALVQGCIQRPYPVALFSGPHGNDFSLIRPA